MKKRRIQSIGLMALVLFLLVQPGAVRAADGYVDVHVHLRGATQSGMLGNIGGGPRMDGPMRRRPPVKFGPPRSRERRDPAQPDSNESQEENLKKAAEILIRKMDRFGVQQALVVVVPGHKSNEEEYASMRKVVGKFPGRLKLMAGGALLSPYLQNMPPDKVADADRARFRQIATQALRDGAVGFGEMISYHLSMASHHSFQHAPADHPLFLVLADIAAQHDVPIDLHMEAVVKNRPMPDNLRRVSAKNPETLEATIPAFERLLAHNRKARIVWQHIGWDNTGEMTPQLVGRLMSDHENLFIALRVEKRMRQVGNGPAMPNRLADRAGNLKPEWRAVIEKFPDRITIGSDEFFFPMESTRPNQSFVETWSLLDQLPEPLARKIGSENPRRIYNLK